MYVPLETILKALTFDVSLMWQRLIYSLMWYCCIESLPPSFEKIIKITNAVYKNPKGMSHKRARYDSLKFWPFWTVS